MNPTPTTDTQRLRELLDNFKWAQGKPRIDASEISMLIILRNEAPALLHELEGFRSICEEYGWEPEQGMSHVEYLRMIAEEDGSLSRAAELKHEKIQAIAERDKLREEVAELREDAKRIGDQFREIGVNPANHNTGEKAAENVVSLVCRIEAERDSLRRENEELKTKLEFDADCAAHAHDAGMNAAYSGVQEVLLHPDCEARLFSDMDGMKPLLRIERYEDSGDSEVGIPRVSFWTVAADQSGTLAEELMKAQEDSRALHDLMHEFKCSDIIPYDYTDRRDLIRDIEEAKKKEAE